MHTQSSTLKSLVQGGLACARSPLRRVLFKRYIYLALCAVCYFNLFSSTIYAESRREIITIDYNKTRYYGGQLCAYPEFTCARVRPRDTWRNRFPNLRERDMVKRLNRTNTALSSRPWIVIPTNLAQLELLDLAPFPPSINTHGEKLLIINLKERAFGAYDDHGELIHWGPISAGKGWCRDIQKYCNTMTGSFHIIRKAGPQCVSDKFPVSRGGGAPMPYCMYYFRGFALHGSRLPGFHASHGCIRLFYDDAQWLNQKFVVVGTPIIVTRE